MPNPPDQLDTAESLANLWAQINLDLGSLWSEMNALSSHSANKSSALRLLRYVDGARDWLRVLESSLVELATISEPSLANVERNRFCACGHIRFRLEYACQTCRGNAPEELRQDLTAAETPLDHLKAVAAIVRRNRLHFSLQTRTPAIPSPIDPQCISAK